LHLVLLGYYFLPATMHEAARQARQRHALWVIEHAPELATPPGALIDLDPDQDGEAYEQAKGLWLRHAEAPGADANTLGAAAQFFTHADQTLAVAMLQKARGMEPDSPEWAQQLGNLYQLGLSRLDGQELRLQAARALAEFEAALALQANEWQRAWLLPDLARTALEAGETGTARAYALKALEQASPPGSPLKDEPDAVHHGNLVLGRLALQDGHVEEAKARLLASVKTTGSPVMKSFGPNMRLAKELLERGERAVVIEYLQLCSVFWQTGDHQAEKWVYEIEQGNVPSFGANLCY
jgi:hypothetical protein